MQAKDRKLTCCLLLAGLFAGCGETTVEPPIRPVRAVRIGDIATINSRSFPGRARATEEVNLSFRVSGPLVEFPVKVGDPVAEDQVLARIDPRDFDVAVENARGEVGRAEAELDAMREGARPEELEQLKAAVQKWQAEYQRALSDFQRETELMKTGATTEVEYERAHQLALKAQAELRTAEEELRIGETGAREEDIRAKEAEIRSLQAALDAAEDRVRYTRLQAPFEGVVAAKYVENFETVQAKQQILRILDTSQIEMVIDIPESLISNADYVKELSCVFDAFPDVTIEDVEIKEIGKEASETTRTFPVTLIMDQPDEKKGPKILPGMAGRVQGRAELPEHAAAVGFDVPESAVFSGDDGRQYVWTIDESSMTVSRRPVEQVRLTSLGMRVRGVQPGEWVATAGVNYLTDGQKVKILEESGANTE